MSWYEIDLGPVFPTAVFGETKVFGHVSTSVYEKPRNEGFWCVRAQWDVVYRILIDSENIRGSNGFREVSVILALQAFRTFNEREPTSAEAAQVRQEALANCDELGPREQSVDGVYNHERMHVIAIASCIEFDSRAGQIRQTLDQLHNAVFPTRESAEAFATAWRERFIVTLRQLVYRGGGHEGAGVSAVVGGIGGAVLPALGLGLSPVSGTSMPGGPAPPRTGGQAEWDAEQQSLAANGYVDLTTP